MTLKGSLL